MKPFSYQHVTRQRRARDPLLAELVAAVDTAPVREHPIRDDALLIFGHHDPADGSISIHIGLARVLIALHELLHRVRPRWSERTVRTRSVQLLHSLTDDDIAAMDAQLVAAIRRSTPPRASSRSARRSAPRRSRGPGCSRPV
jgi:hypothetical protein